MYHHLVSSSRLQCSMYWSKLHEVRPGAHDVQNLHFVLGLADSRACAWHHVSEVNVNRFSNAT